MNSQRLVCFHCQEPVAPPVIWTTAIDGVTQPMCCIGCQSVSRAIVAAGAQAYYQQRTAAGLSAEALQVLMPWSSLLSDPQWSSRHVTHESGDLSQTTLAIEGLRCGACAWLIEKILTTTAGIAHAQANATTGRLFLKWDSRQTDLRRISAEISRIGYALLPVGSAPLEARRKATRQRLLRQMFIAGLASSQIMMYAYPEYIEGSGLDDDTRLLMRTASMLITLPVIGFSAVPFFASAWRALAQRRLNMDVPITFGLLLAFGASLAAWWTRQGEVYFDSVAMFVFLLLGIRWIQSGLEEKNAQYREQLLTALPALAKRILPQRARLAPWALDVGDVIEVASGERLPADGRLMGPATEIDNALLTGESLPVRVALGERLTEGSVNLGPAIRVLIDRPASDGTLSRLSRLAEQAAADRPRWTLWADRIGARFTLAILLITALLIALALLRDLPFASAIAPVIAVLVVSCPCALSMAGPAGYSAALASLLRSGLAVSSSASLERSQSVTDVVFDKTGTLTDPAQSTARMAFGPESLWPQIYALTAKATHPLAQTIARTAEPYADPGLEAQEVRQWPGLGISGRLSGHEVRCGSASFVDPRQQYPSLAGGHPSCTVFFSLDGSPVAGFEIRDTARREAPEVIAKLQSRGITVWCLSGDRHDRALSLCSALGIRPEHVLADKTPDQKRDAVRALQSQGKVVAMVGDGHNDAPVLAQADVSIAINGASALAQQKADIYCISPGITPVTLLIQKAGELRRIIGQNLLWAIAYNLLAIPFAAMGLVSPLMASVGMAISSLVVMANSTRLLKTA